MSAKMFGFFFSFSFRSLLRNVSRRAVKKLSIENRKCIGVNCIRPHALFSFWPDNRLVTSYNNDTWPLLNCAILHFYWANMQISIGDRALLKQELEEFCLPIYKYKTLQRNVIRVYSAIIRTPTANASRLFDTALLFNPLFYRFTFTQCN